MKEKPGAMICDSCGIESATISGSLGLCRQCIESEFERYRDRLVKLHRRTRAEFGLPEVPPAAPDGTACGACARNCSLAEGETGYCGARRGSQGRIVSAAGPPNAAFVSCYFDPLPTNCVAAPVCPGCSGAGYPEYSHTRGPERGYKNLAVFYASCNFNCLFCQNWHYREQAGPEKLMTPAEVAEVVDEETSCICFFGGDPATQTEHSLEVARIAREKAAGRHLRICWETNGSMNPAALKKMIAVALESGGTIKFDLKAFSPKIHFALCGIANRQTLNNFRLLAQAYRERPNPPAAVASTLLVPGYVNPGEVWRIATFIASKSLYIPYSLLAFSPHFYMNDLPATSRNHARDARDTAIDAGLERVFIGNSHLLVSDDYSLGV